MTTGPLYQAETLVRFANDLFAAAGLDADKAAVVADFLVDSEMMGHTSGGLQLIASYLKSLEAGGMAKTGLPDVINDRCAAITLDGRRLPGPWLMAHAIDLGVERIERCGLVGIAIRDSHHIGCPTVLLHRAAQRGAMVLMFSSDPAETGVAPHGVPHPIGVGIPTESDPILIDIGASAVAGGPIVRSHRDGPHPWVMDAVGVPSETSSPHVATPSGTHLPSGGADHDHKSYGLMLTVEALTQGLSGFGRADQPKHWSTSVYLQFMDPEAFGGSAAFLRQTGWLAEVYRTAHHRAGGEPARLPGERALKLRRKALADGVSLHPGVLSSLAEPASRYGVALPQPASE